MDANQKPMLFDITLKGTTFLVTLHKKMMEEEMYRALRPENPRMSPYAHLGTFSDTAEHIGFGNCLTKINDDEDYAHFSFDFPPRTSNEKAFEKKNVIGVHGEDHWTMRKFMTTVHLLTYYVLRDMHSRKILIDGNWRDQSLSFNIQPGGSGSGYGLGGMMYPWIKERLRNLDEEHLNALTQHVRTEMQRCAQYFSGEEMKYEDVSVSKESWFMQCNLN